MSEKYWWDLSCKKNSPLLRPDEFTVDINSLSRLVFIAVFYCCLLVLVSSKFTLKIANKATHTSVKEKNTIDDFV